MSILLLLYELDVFSFCRGGGKHTFFFFFPPKCGEGRGYFLRANLWVRLEQHWIYVYMIEYSNIEMVYRLVCPIYQSDMYIKSWVFWLRGIGSNIFEIFTSAQRDGEGRGYFLRGNLLVRLEIYWV
jgi:hypothetical protein